MPKTVPALPGIPPSRYPFSEVVEANGFVFLAGQVGDVPGTPGRRARRHRGRDPPDARERRPLLRAAGLDYADVVKCTVYLRDFSEFGAMNTVYREFFPIGAADPGDGRRDRAGRGLPGRDRGAGDPLSAPDRQFAARAHGTDVELVDGDHRPAARADDLDGQACRRPAFQSGSGRPWPRASNELRSQVDRPDVRCRRGRRWALPRVGPSGPYTAIAVAGERDRRGRAGLGRVADLVTGVGGVPSDLPGAAVVDQADAVAVALPGSSWWRDARSVPPAACTGA